MFSVSSSSFSYCPPLHEPTKHCPSSHSLVKVTLDLLMEHRSLRTTLKGVPRLFFLNLSFFLLFGSPFCTLHPLPGSGLQCWDTQAGTRQQDTQACVGESHRSFLSSRSRCFGSSRILNAAMQNSLVCVFLLSSLCTREERCK